MACSCKPSGCAASCLRRLIATNSIIERSCATACCARWVRLVLQYTTTSFVAEPSEALRAVSEDARARLLTALSAVAAAPIASTKNRGQA